jgi:predicted Zn-dependent protease
METEADYIGLKLMDRAHYNVEEAPKVWQRMLEQNQDGPGLALLSTHPTSQMRIEQKKQLELQEATDSKTK